jgi:hypothetical protein
MAIALAAGLASACGGEQFGFPRVPVSAVSPDGRFTAFVRNHPNIDPPDQDLWLQERGGDAVRLGPLAPDNEWCDAIVWSADSSRVAFVVKNATLQVYEAETRTKVFDAYPGRRPNVFLKDVSLSADGTAAVFNECDLNYQSSPPERQNRRGTRVDPVIDRCTTERRTVSLDEAAEFFSAHPALAWTLDSLASTWMTDGRPAKRIELDGAAVRITAFDATGMPARVMPLRLDETVEWTDGGLTHRASTRWDDGLVVEWDTRDGALVTRGVERRSVSLDGHTLTVTRAGAGAVVVTTALSR